jgi:hypothetical protein
VYDWSDEQGASLLCGLTPGITKTTTFLKYLILYLETEDGMVA